MGVTAIGHQRKLASSSCHPTLLSLGAFQRSLEGRGPDMAQEPPSLPFLSELGSTRKKVCNCTAVCLVQGRAYTAWGKEVLMDLKPNISKVRRNPELWPAASQPSHPQARGGVGGNSARYLPTGNSSQLWSASSSPEWVIVSSLPLSLSLSLSLSLFLSLSFSLSLSLSLSTSLLFLTLSPKHIFG